MKTLISKIWPRYREQILYVFFGGCTTLVNIVCYYVFASLFGMDTDIANAIAWLLSVIFAYVTNRIFVFRSQERSAKGILREIVSFFGARLATGLLDEGIMHVGVKVLSLPDMPMKIASNILVIILNYIFSKWIVFKKQTKKEEKAP